MIVNNCLKICVWKASYSNKTPQVAVHQQDGNNHLAEYSKDPLNNALTREEIDIAESIFENYLNYNKNPNPIQSDSFTFYPMMGNSIRPGVIAVKHSPSFSVNIDEFWDTFITLISNAVEKEFLNELARKARFLNESDNLYKTLFNSISHELRIPVATIMSASESLLMTRHPKEIQMELSHEILRASNRLNRLIENLLNMSRLESGRITLRLDWCDIHDLINKVSENRSDELTPIRLHVVISHDMLIVMIDFGLLEQVLYNLIYNATQ